MIRPDCVALGRTPRRTQEYVCGGLGYPLAGRASCQAGPSADAVELVGEMRASRMSSSAELLTVVDTDGKNAIADRLSTHPSIIL